MPQIKTPDELKGFIKKKQDGIDPDKITISVCTGTGCKASGGGKLYKKFQDEISDKNINAEVISTGCHGFCERGPLVVMRPSGLLYQKVKCEDVTEIIEKTIKNGEKINRLFYRDQNHNICEKEEDVPFYKHQERVVFEMNGHIDPTRMDDYLSKGGYSAFAKVLTEIKSNDVIDMVVKSGLRGRGGGGFPTGMKWKLTADSIGDKKYIICNADEGDPGAFMDRSLLEGNPHLVIEGLLIAAFSVGASEGYIYVRNEYPMAVENMSIALRDAEKIGLLGKNILGTGFSLNLKIVRGGGAFVCGEETALIASIEGVRGVPVSRPPYPAKKGLFGKPTNINNVETLCNIPYIINRGVEWYTSIGTGDVSKSPFGGSKGTKIFSLVGKVNNTGLVEVPMGVSLKHIVYDIGGGIKNSKKGRKFKAVQTGGPSGGCIPEEHINEPVDFDELAKLGSMMGSGGMIVMDDRTCMVEVARYFVDFLKEESCGKCTPCREGLRRMSEILNRIIRGKGRFEDLELLEDLAEVMKDSSLCGLGQTAANPVLSTMRYFREEYEDHISKGLCAGRQCMDLILYKINPDNCTGCDLCAKRCPTKAIYEEGENVHFIHQDKCVKCGVCFDVCNLKAIDVLSGPQIKNIIGEKS